MARWALLVTAACGCNAIYGNDRAVARDAHYFDAPADSAFQCPAPGSPPPEFNIELHGVFVQPCRDFSLRGDRATAACTVDGTTRVYEGPLTGPLALVTTFVVPNKEGLFDQPRLSSDAQILYARFTNFADLLEVHYATREAGDQWKPQGIAPIFTTANDSMSTIAPAPDGDHILVREAGSNAIHEWVGRGADWHEVRVQTAAELGIGFAQVKLSLDGLRLTATTLDGMYYSDRPALDAPFRAAVPFPTAPIDNSGGQMTADCARIYVADLGEVFYAQQR